MCPNMDTSFLFCFNFLLHVNKMLLAVIKFVLQEGHFLRRNYMYAHAIFHLPFAFKAYYALIDICCYIGMYMQIEFLNSNLID